MLWPGWGRCAKREQGIQKLLRGFLASVQALKILFGECFGLLSVLFGPPTVRHRLLKHAGRLLTQANPASELPRISSSRNLPGLQARVPTPITASQDLARV